MDRERIWLDLIKSRFRQDHDGIETGIGDDAAVLRSSNDRFVVSTDAQFENVHFDRNWLTFDDVGWRSQIAAVSDITAMGAKAEFATIAIAAPDDVNDHNFEKCLDGISSASEEIGYSVVGGNLARASEFSITTTITGVPFEKPVLRSQAKPGQELFVTGTLGTAALGLQTLLKGQRSNEFVQMWRRPTHRTTMAYEIAKYAEAAIDLSDGLSIDLRNLCESSSVGATIEYAALIRSSNFDKTSASLGVDPVELMLSGGEDYEILFTTRNPKQASQFAIRIGTTTESPVISLNHNGTLTPIKKTGFSHWK